MSPAGSRLLRILVLLIALAAWGCATPSHRYLYRPAAPVTPEDWAVCHARADTMAQRRYDRYEEIVEIAGPFGGPFGGVTLAWRAREEREDVYEEEMKTCLAERGYRG